MANFLTDFGFNPEIEKKKDFEAIDFGPKKSNKKILWTIYVYISLSLGIFLRNVVNYPNAKDGLNTAVIKVGVIIASFIIALALLSPLLKFFSRLHKGQLSWEHCLSAFTIGFFGDLTFQILVNKFVKLI